MESKKLSLFTCLRSFSRNEVETLLWCLFIFQESHNPAEFPPDFFQGDHKSYSLPPTHTLLFHWTMVIKIPLILLLLLLFHIYKKEKGRNGDGEMENHFRLLLRGFLNKLLPLIHSLPLLLGCAY